MSLIQFTEIKGTLGKWK